jgi:cardiolipin synthase
MHHKIFVVDARYAVVGGINISNRYNDIGDTPAWLDMALFVEGEVAQQLCVLCWKTWKSFPINMGITPCEEMNLDFSYLAEQPCRIRIRRNDWVRRKNEISSTYAQMIRFAKSEITILCSYFLPGKVIRRLLSEAALRGVKVTIITAGPSDVMLSKRAERWLYDWLLRNNIDLYEYQPTVLHAKVAVCDGRLLTIGSYNVNDLSAYASIELNLDVQNEELTQSMRNVIEKIIEKDCKLITKAEYYKTKNLIRQFSRWLSYKLIRLVFHMLTFYYKQKA